MIKRILLVAFFTLSGIYFGNDPGHNLLACEMGVTASCSSAPGLSWTERSVKEKIDRYFSTHLQAVEEVPTIKDLNPDYLF